MTTSTSRFWNTPKSLTNIAGRWGYHIEEDCCVESLPDLEDVCLNEPVQEDQILVYYNGCWVNMDKPTPPVGPTTACWQEGGGFIDYYRLADRLFPLPFPAVDIPVNIQNPFKIPVANFTPDPSGTGGMNNYMVRGSAITTILDLSDATLGSLWVHVGSINTPITTPAPPTIPNNNSSPSIVVDPNECVKISFHCLTSPKLKAGRLDDGNLGMFFRLRADPPSSGDRYFQTSLNPNYAFDYMWITECDSHSYSDNALVIEGDVTISTTFYLESILYQGIRYGTTNNLLNGINVQGLFEIEPFFQLVKEKIVLS